jgi:hypothetical protein
MGGRLAAAPSRQELEWIEFDAVAAEFPGFSY